MKKCPICEFDLPEPLPAFCPQEGCGWDLKDDRVVHVHLPDHVVEEYRQRLQIARKNWNERLEAIRKQEELEGELEKIKAEKDEAEKRRAEEEAFWSQCKHRNTVASYHEYQARYPKGLHQSDAARAIRSLEENEKKAAEDQFWQEVLSQDCKEGYESYLRAYPDGRYTPRARVRLKEIEDKDREALEEICWHEAAKQDKQGGYEEYLRRYPQGKYAPSGKQKVEEIKESIAWVDAENEDTVQGYRRYLERYPKGKHVSQARSRIAAIGKTEEAKARVTPPPHVPKRNLREGYEENLGTNTSTGHTGTRVHGIQTASTRDSRQDLFSKNSKNIAWLIGALLLLLVYSYLPFLQPPQFILKSFPSLATEKPLFLWIPYTINLSALLIYCVYGILFVVLDINKYPLPNLVEIALLHLSKDENELLKWVVCGVNAFLLFLTTTSIICFLGNYIGIAETGFGKIVVFPLGLIVVVTGLGSYFMAYLYVVEIFIKLIHLVFKKTLGR